LNDSLANSVRQARVEEIPTDESIDLFTQAIDIMKVAGDNPTERQYRDALSLMSLAAQKAGEPFPLVHLAMAQTYYDMGDLDGAWNAATNTLQHQQDNFEAQLIKVCVAADTVQIVDKDDGGTAGSAWRLIRAMFSGSSRSSYHAGKEFGERAVGGAVAKQTQTRFKNEVLTLLRIFERLCANGLSSDLFLKYAHDLIGVADAINKHGIPFRSEVNVYAVISRVPVDKLTYADEQQRQEVVKFQRIAEGRSTLR